MRTSKTQALPARLAALRRFDHWHENRTIGSHLPERPWSAAAKQACLRARRTGRRRSTASTRRPKRFVISGGWIFPGEKLPGASRPPVGRTRDKESHPRPVYDALKRRVEENSASRSKTPAPPPAARFVEWSAAGRTGIPECVVELEDVEGTTFRMFLRATPHRQVQLNAIDAGDLVTLGRGLWRVE